MIIESLGFVEVRGASNAIAVADAMIKTSDIKILSETKLDPGQITIVVEGDLGACMAAVDAGTEVAKQNNCFISSLVKGKPDIAVEQIFSDAVHSNRPKPVAPKTNALTKTTTSNPKVEITSESNQKQDVSAELESSKAEPVKTETINTKPAKAENKSSTSTSTEKMTTTPAVKKTKVSTQEVLKFISDAENGTTVADIAENFNIGLRESRSHVSKLVEDKAIERFNRGVRLIDDDSE